MASQMVPKSLEFMNRCRGCVREIFKVSYASWFSLYSLLWPFPKQLPNHNFDPWGKCTKSSPNAIKMSKMDSNDKLMNIILEININYNPPIIHLSYIHSSIRNSKHYHGIYQNRVEMVIVCSLKVILTYNSWEFLLDTFFKWEIENIELISIING